ncbi:MAG: hypothetical protein QG609_25 [Patescibacteria group bacterium]|nr:hypothetical protein [Patescibacteria group bacterium]
MTSTASKKYFSVSTFIFGLAGILISFLILFWTVDAQTASGLSGYAWSSNIGWIQTNPVFGGVTFSNNVFSGYAWSSNIGWINFNPTGPYPENPQTGVRFNPTNKSITGWARALSYGGGWDGWIKMSGTASNGNTYGIVSNPTGLLSGYAWGDDVVGWVDFSRVTCNGCATTLPTVPTLTASKTGTGSGTITSVPAGINCGAACGSASFAYANGTRVVLTAQAGANSQFGNWSGCDITSGMTCTVNMATTNRSASVLFNSTGGPSDPTLTVVKTGTGTGLVVSNPAGINCGSDCNNIYTRNSSVILTATTDANTEITWSSNCVVGSNPNQCTVVVDQSKTVTTTFDREVSGDDDSFTIEGCTNEIAGRCVLVVQCDKVGVDCAGDEVYSDDNFTVNYTGNSEGPVIYNFSTTGSPIPEWLRITDCNSSTNNSSCVSSVGSGGTISRTGSFVLKAKELLMSGDTVPGSYAKIVTISTSPDNSFEFILRLIPKSGGGQ